jgi:outer membrane autotransporter protein
VADFSALVTPGSDAYDLIAALPDAQAAGVVISNGYIRSAEIASTLIGLQSVFADQVKSRIRSHMQYDGVGFPASSAPGGASGWDAMRDFSDRLESDSWDAVRDLSDRLESGINTDGMRELSDRLESGINTDGMREFSDSMEDRFGYEEVSGSVDTVSDAVIPDLGIETMGLPTEWQTWGSGYGSYIDQDTTSDFAGYQASLGGGILGIDKRINNLLLGVGGGYAHTVLQGYESKDARADSWQSVAYFSAHGDHVYLDASASYAFSSVDTEYDVLGYTGDFGAQTIGLYLGGGFAFTMLDTVVLTPETSILNTLYLREAYTESSSIDGMPTLQWDDYDQWSHLTKVGATLSPVQAIDLADLEIACRPEIRAHWLHEFNPEMDNETYIMDGGSYIVGASLMAREEDMLYVGGGVRLSKWSSDTTEFGLDVDGALADNYSAYIVSGKIIHRF